MNIGKKNYEDFNSIKIEIFLIRSIALYQDMRFSSSSFKAHARVIKFEISPPYLNT